jgi:hypothetical protein
MKKNRMFLTIIFLCFISCKEEDKKKLIEPSNLKKESVKIKTPIFSERDFAMIYKYSEDDSNQILGIKIINKRKIEFHLVTETLPCDTEYWGIAEDKYSHIASEIDEDESGTSYGAIEFVKNEAKYIISIRMALDSSKVQIKYSEENDLGTDCLTITGRIMKRIK